MPKRLILILIAAISLAGVSAKIKPLNFANPGNKRLMKTETENYYYYRSLPEKALELNVTGISALEIRSFAIEDLRKPQFTVTINKAKTVYNLVLKQRLDGYYVFEPVKVTLPAGTKSVELLCYERSIYFRSFYDYVAPAKPKEKKPDNLVIKAHGGILSVTHNGSDSDYYIFNPTQSFKFTVNNKRNAEIYVRARILDRTLPVFELYRNGQLVQQYEFTLKRTTKYKAVGIDFLSIGMKLDLPRSDGPVEYELRAKSEHLFLARPIILKSH
jgi:hypothetical protein